MSGQACQISEWERETRGEGLEWERETRGKGLEWERETRGEGLEWERLLHSLIA